MARIRNPLLKMRNLFMVATALVIAGLGVAFLSLRPARSFASLAEFPAERYLEDEVLFSQEDFRLNATVENVLLRSKDGKKFLVWVRPRESEHSLPVLMEPGEKNLQRNQELLMKVHVLPSGAILCRAPIG